ncbi:hypothetical protein V6N11_048074, partial [Hibiscus sabdariffa]
MGCTRDKHIRSARRTRSVKHEIDHCCHLDKASSVRPLSYHLGVNNSTRSPNLNPNNNTNANFNDHGWGYCTEDELEEILLKNLEVLYNEAISKLISLRYDEDVALKAILRSGYCYGGMDVLTNVLHNSLAYLNSSCDHSDGSNSEESESGFPDLRQLEEYWLAGKATTMEIPSLPSPTSACSPVTNNPESAEWVDFMVVGGLGMENVAIFAASFGANSKQMQTQSQACVGTLSSGDVPLAVARGEVSAEKSEESQTLISQDGVNSVLSKFRDLNIDENLEHVGEDKKSEMVISLLHQIKDLEKQVKERKDWAHQKAMQAARKLSNDLTELKMLRMEREEMQLMKKGKHTIEDSTMKRLSEMENALRKASGQVDRANAAVRRLETENAEIRAEMEASKLSASESVTTCLEVAKREKKCLKKLLAWEKQKAKLQELIADEKEKIKDLQRILARVEQDQKETESKWREELKAKELAMAQVEKERCSKEATEVSNKRKLEALRLKIEIDFQRHKDDHQRLEQELSRLNLSVQSTELNDESDNLLTGKSEGA